MDINGLTLFPMGGGHMATPAENRPFSVEKMKFFKNGWTEKPFIRGKMQFVFLGKFEGCFEVVLIEGATANQ